MPIEWIAEEDAMQTLLSAWKTLPPLRTMRVFWQTEKIATQRAGAHGKLHLDANVIRALAADYVPLQAVLAKNNGSTGAIENRYTAKLIGRLHLIRRIDALDVIKTAENDQIGKSDRLRNCKTDPSETVKQAPEHGIEASRNVA